MNSKRYVVWDGQTLSDYRWNGNHDCIVSGDLRLISVQRLRTWMIARGIDPIVIFACQAGMPAAEINIPGHGGRGLAAYCQQKALEENPSITIRDLITRTNALVQEMGFDQVGEVICEEHFLELRFFDVNRPPTTNDAPVALLELDMCRTPGQLSDFVADFDEFSPFGTHAQRKARLSMNDVERERQHELMETISKVLPEARTTAFQEKGLETLWGVMVSAVEIGAVGALWKVLELWVTRYANGSIKVSYPAEDNSTVEVTYTKLTKQEVERVLAAHPPKANRPIKLILPPFE